jgi:hypothetical protein
MSVLRGALRHIISQHEHFTNGVANNGQLSFE